MTKRIRKPAVTPEVRRQWFKRFEEEGESPPHIAKADGFDVRTVRKQIEVERQERERREARSVVLRKALEDHYADLCGFARKMGLALMGEGTDLSTLKNDRLWSALREHLPRSTMWKSFDKMGHLQDEIRQLEGSLKEEIEPLVRSRSPVKFPVTHEEVGITDDIISPLFFHSRATAGEKPGVDIKAAFNPHATGEGMTEIWLGAILMGKVTNKQVAEVKQMVGELLEEVTRLPEHGEIRRRLEEIGRVQQALDDELAIITLRRIVPGRCRYCPL